MTGWRRNGWVTLLMAAVLAGCGDDGEPPEGAGAPSPTLTRTVAAEPTATPPATSTESPVPTETATSQPTPSLTATSTSTAVATATLTATLTVTPTVTPTATITDTPTATPTETPVLPFRVRSSVQQLLVEGGTPGMVLGVRDGEGREVGNGVVDANGTLIFRDLVPGPGFVVYGISGGAEGEIADPRDVWAPGDVPPDSFYASQRVVEGYQYITTRDGTQLAINVVLPGPIEDGPYPTVIEYSGYDPANPDAPQPSTLLASALGYAAVGINMRGTGCSGGSFNFFELAQSTDGYDAIEIIARQPWVKFQRVGMVGVSYPGISQLFVAQLQPPHLAAITPLSVISDTARGILYPGGILNNGFATDWAIERQRDGEPFGQPWSARRRDQGDQTCIANQRFRGQNPRLLDLIAENRVYRPEIGDPLGPVNFVDRINVPVFLAGAWQDEQTGGYFPNMLDRFTGTERKFFTMTNGGHTDCLSPPIFTRWTEFLSFYVRREIPELPATAKLVLPVIAQQVFGVRSVRIEPDRFLDEPSYESALARFEAEPRVRILFENGGTNREGGGAPEPRFEASFDQWPPPAEAWIRYFAADGRLAEAPPEEGGVDSYDYDPSRSQLLTIEGGDDSIWKKNPNWNWRQSRADRALVYESDPLEETLVMSGSGSVDLWLRSTASDTDLQVTLSEVRPDGKEVYVQSGFLRASFRATDPQQSTIFRPVQNLLESDIAPLPTDEFSETRVEIFPFAHVFRPGSRVRILVDTPGATRPRWRFDVLQPEGTVVNSIGRSVATPSRIVLPVLPGVEAPEGLSVCPGLRLQYCRDYRPFTNRSAD